jgi:hypothetical protein
MRRERTGDLFIKGYNVSKEMRNGFSALLHSRVTIVNNVL